MDYHAGADVVPVMSKPDVGQVDLDEGTRVVPDVAAMSLDSDSEGSSAPGAEVVVTLSHMLTDVTTDTAGGGGPHGSGGGGDGVRGAGGGGTHVNQARVLEQTASLLLSRARDLVEAVVGATDEPHYRWLESGAETLYRAVRGGNFVVVPWCRSVPSPLSPLPAGVARARCAASTGHVAVPAPARTVARAHRVPGADWPRARGRHRAL